MPRSTESITYTVIVQEDDASLGTLGGNHYNLQVAKSVSTPNGPPSFNVVYKSAFLANTMSVAWNTTYGLNWVTNIPSPGTVVTYSGKWQQCSLGDSYDLNTSGQWIPNQNNPNADPNSLNVGSNGYQTAVHIIVGVQDPVSQGWTPVSEYPKASMVLSSAKSLIYRSGLDQTPYS